MLGHLVVRVDDQDRVKGCIEQFRIVNGTLDNGHVRQPLVLDMTEQPGHAAAHRQTSRIAQYWALTKPRVTQLAVFCAVIGMFLATDGLPALALAVDPPEPDLMKRKPRDPRTGIFTRPVVTLMVLGGIWSTIINLALLPLFGTGLFEAPIETIFSEA
mgnify:CR=1 FL=1